MPALPSDIAAALRPQMVVSAQDAAIKTRFPSARDGSDDPVEGFFDSATDATAALAQRMALLGTVRRRFVVAVNDVVEVTPGTVPTHRVIDAEQGLDASLLLSRIEVDLEQETTQLEYLG